MWAYFERLWFNYHHEKDYDDSIERYRLAGLVRWSRVFERQQIKQPVEVLQRKYSEFAATNVLELLYELTKYEACVLDGSSYTTPVHFYKSDLPTRSFYSYYLTEEGYGIDLNPTHSQVVGKVKQIVTLPQFNEGETYVIRQGAYLWKEVSRYLNVTRVL